MLAYAYQTLYFSEYKSFTPEKFKNVIELYAEILIIGVPVLIRSGLLKDYILINEKSSVIRGKLDLNTSIKQNSMIDNKLLIVYDEFSEDIFLNQILKATLAYLARSRKISKEKRHKFLSFLVYFKNVSDIELSLSQWKNIKYNRQNIRYQFLIDICRFLYEEMILSVSSGYKNQGINDEQRLSSLYEKFVYAFYKKETQYKVTRPQIKWKVDDGSNEALPIMQTDMVLQNKNNTLIIDTKFYSENMGNRYNKDKLISANLYQIFTYINNWRPRDNEKVSGMLLYAKTTADVQPNYYYEINGNSISVVTIDLNKDFEIICSSLKALVTKFL
ncbi:5-methylcytosine restriction system specificity protein McrC [Otariodibacter oris]|uniref:5-methylcytosine-specific restriction enzyme subunit McrC n=1 Tax=Otariodibacter oris TaxID=1032623 RepID=A0A420XEX5_9PAST|nr:hypothetical protein [Otariodibacter oris]RKR71056.1 5-methylcytosine-specific restriction enzyme subunit McrC [Otariodibacter oris]